MYLILIIVILFFLFFLFGYNKKYDWKEDIEKKMGLEYKEYGKLSEIELITKLESKNWGTYYSIWNALKKIGTIESIPSLTKMLSSLKEEKTNNNRYHCAEILYILCKKNNQPLPEIMNDPDLKKMQNIWEEGIQPRE
jgi:hypothetical protein